MRSLNIVVASCLVLMTNAAAAQAQEPPFVAVDQNLWVAFYDLPSHRFRAIRDSYIKRDFDSAARDLVASASYLQIESARALPAIARRLDEVAAQLTWISQNLNEPGVTSTMLDQLFGRAHWLLAQHFLYLARTSRDANMNQLAGRYLWATTHHLERAVLWSNARIDGELLATLDELRDLSLRLQDDEKALSARKEKPILRAEKLLKKLGAVIDRPVVLEFQ